MSQIHKHNPAIQAEIYSRRYGGFTVKSPQRYLSSRTLENPTASARIMFRDTVVKTDRKSVDGRAWGDVLQSNDLIKVTIMGRDNKRHIDIYGLVKNVEIMQIDMAGEPEHYTEIKLEGFGSELVNYRIFWHPHLAGRNNLGGLGYLARSKGNIPKGKPHEVVKSLFDTFMNDEYVFQFADGDKLTKKLEFRGESSELSLGRTGLSALGMEGPLWATLKRYADQPWHEIFLDIQHERELVNLENRPDTSAQSGFTSTTRAQSPLSAFFKNQEKLFGKVGLYFRPTPFTFDRWNKLAISTGWGFTLDEEERLDDGFELFRDISKVYSFFFATGKGVYSAFDQISSSYERANGVIPIYDADLVKRYGFRDLVQGTEYVDFKTKQDETHGTNTTSTFTKYEMLILRTLQLYLWHGYTDFWDGTLSTIGRIGPDPKTGIRIGSVITRKSTGWQYYVTGVQQVYNYPGQHTTRITVERGRDPQKYLEWWVSRVQSQYTDALSTSIPQYQLERFGLWPKGRDLRIPLGNVPILPHGVS